MSLSLPKNLEPMLAKPVAIFGGGLSGRALAELVAALGGRSVIYDEKAGAGERRSFTDTEAGEHTLVVFSPGFRVEHPWLTTAVSAGCVCLGEIDFSSLFWHGRLLAITGTNGKTTLTEFLTHALNSCGLAAEATGNIGHPLSRLVLEREGGEADMVAVCEVSSFQAETMAHFQPDTVLWTNFAEDHLERHPGLRAYFSAKYELLSRCAPASCFVGSSVAAFAAGLGFSLPAQALVQTEGRGADGRLVDTVFSDYPQRENFLLAKAWWQSQQLPEEALYAAARSFKLGRHRLAVVGEFEGVTYWNDSKATNFHAVEAALARFPVQVILILGGKAKGGDINAFVQRIAPRVRHALLIGETQAILAEACVRHGLVHSLCTTLDEAVETARGLAQPGDQVLLSPAFASFDMFRGYDHRGEVFEQLVRALAAGREAVVFPFNPTRPSNPTAP